MKITSAKFVKGILGTDRILEDDKPQVAFIGRSNVGKSSVINSLTNQKGLAKTSSFPGRTTEINLFLINGSLYLVDLPGYGFAKTSLKQQEQIQGMIHWYLFRSEHNQKKVVIIIDANIGPSDIDLEIINDLSLRAKNVIVVANKIDKIKKSAYHAQMKKIQDLLPGYKIIPYSAEKKLGVKELADEILN
jgi:GTP-binding protein